MAIIAVIPTIAALSGLVTVLAWIGIAIGVVGLISALVWGGHLDVSLAMLGLIIGAIGFFVTSVFWSIALAAIGLILALAGLYLWITADSDSGDDKAAWMPPASVEPGDLEEMTPWRWPPVRMAALPLVENYASG
jgi:hypothetical protein